MLVWGMDFLIYLFDKFLFFTCTWNVYWGKESDDHGQIHDFPNHYWSFFKFKAERKAMELAGEYEAVWFGEELSFSSCGSFVNYGWGKEWITER